jgi:hypothetical protein
MAPSGVYVIQPDGDNDVTVWCDMDTDGGGWTVSKKKNNKNVLTNN